MAASKGKVATVAGSEDEAMLFAAQVAVSAV